MTEHGEDAAIAAVNRIRSGGVAGFFCREEFEVIVDPNGERAAVTDPTPNGSDDPPADPGDETIGQALARSDAADRPPARLAFRAEDHPVEPADREDDGDQTDGAEDSDDPAEVLDHEQGPDGDDASPVFGGPIPPGDQDSRDRFLALLERRLEETSTVEADLQLRRTRPDRSGEGAAAASTASVPPAPTPAAVAEPTAGSGSTPPPTAASAAPVSPGQAVSTGPGATPADGRPRPVFWRRIDRARQELASYLPAGSPLTAVVGPLPQATAVVHRLQATAELAAAEVIVLTDRAGIVSEPGWHLVRTGDRLVRLLSDQVRPAVIVVIDAPVDLPHWVPPLQRRLRPAGIGLFRYAVAGQPTGAELERYRQGADVPYAIDLVSRVDPHRIVELVADRHPVTSVAGAELGPELLLAMRRHVGADELLFEPVIDG